MQTIDERAFSEKYQPITHGDASIFMPLRKAVHLANERFGDDSLSHIWTAVQADYGDYGDEILAEAGITFEGGNYYSKNGEVLPEYVLTNLLVEHDALSYVVTEQPFDADCTNPFDDRLIEVVKDETLADVLEQYRTSVRMNIHAMN